MFSAPCAMYLKSAENYTFSQCAAHMHEIRPQVPRFGKRCLQENPKGRPNSMCAHQVVTFQLHVAVGKMERREKKGSRGGEKTLPHQSHYPLLFAHCMLVLLAYMHTRAPVLASC